MIFTRYTFFVLLMLSKLVDAESLLSRPKEVTGAMQKMYSISANMFEAGEFNGKYDPDRQCALMEDFFLKSLLIRPQKNQGCDVGQSVFIRYPGFNGSDFDIYGNSGQMPNAKCQMPNAKCQMPNAKTKT